VPATAGVERHFDLSQANFNDPNTSLFISPPTTPTCTSATDSFSPLIQCPTHIPEGGRQIPPPSCDPDPGALTCMWGGCYASFPSLSELVGHVNLQHLRPFSPSGPAMTAPPQGKFQLPENTAGPSCHWADCNVYPSPNSIPGPSSGNQVDSALDLLAAHLLHDHLGLSTRESALSGSTAPIAFQSDKIGFDEITSSNFPDPSHFSPPHECSGPHICHWQSCKQAYSSCEDLTEHMVAFHVGAGKSRYECFWKDCNRNGENGFSSKQKICRHLQVLPCFFDRFVSTLMISLRSLTRDIDRFSAKFASRIFSRLQRYSSIYVGTLKKVSAGQLIDICIDYVCLNQNRIFVIFLAVEKLSRSQGL